MFVSYIVPFLATLKIKEGAVNIVIRTKTQLLGEGYSNQGGGEYQCSPQLKRVSMNSNTIWYRRFSTPSGAKYVILILCALRVQNKVDRRCITFPLSLQRENEAKEREMRDLEAFVKKENAERKKETRAIEEAR